MATPQFRNADEGLVYDFATDCWVEETQLVAARWTRELPHPETPPREGRWYRPRAKAGVRWRTLTKQDASRLSAIGWWSLGATILALIFDVFGPAGLPLLLALCLGLLIFNFVLIERRISLSSPEWTEAKGGDLALLDTPEDLDVCLVEILIVHYGRSCGSDRGVAWFEGGRLLFSGHRTSFAIGGEDVLPVRDRGSQYGGGYWTGSLFGGLPEDAIPLRQPWGRSYVRFAPLGHDHAWERQAWRFMERLRVFRSRPPKSRGPRQWPPFRP